MSSARSEGAAIAAAVGATGERAPAEGDAGEFALTASGVGFGAGGRKILRDVSLEVREAEVVALLGPSGCGKTTLLRVIAGLERPDSGRVEFHGSDLTAVPAHRRGFGMMFQDFALFPHLDAGRNVAFGLRYSGVQRLNRDARVAELLQLVGLEGYQRRTVETLSGGERQRVALARTLAPRPRLVMLDEPLGSLDRALRERLLVELKEILARLGIPSIYVTHDQAEAFAVASRVMLMNAGQIVRVDSPQAIYAEPRTPFVARYLGLNNIVKAFPVGGRLETPAGAWPMPAGYEPRDGAVHLLLRGEGVRLVGEGGEGVASGVLVSRLFQGPSTLIHVETAVGRLVFELPGGSGLPADGSPVHVLVPHVQVLQNDEGAD